MVLFWWLLIWWLSWSFFCLFLPAPVNKIPRFTCICTCWSVPLLMLTVVLNSEENPRWHNLTTGENNTQLRLQKTQTSFYHKGLFTVDTWSWHSMLNLWLQFCETCQRATQLAPECEEERSKCSFNYLHCHLSKCLLSKRCTSMDRSHIMDSFKAVRLKS